MNYKLLYLLVLIITSIYSYGQEDKKLDGDIFTVECDCIGDSLIIDTTSYSIDTSYFILRINNCSDLSISFLPVTFFFADQVEINSDTEFTDDNFLGEFTSVKYLLLQGKGFSRIPKTIKSLKKLSILSLNNTSIKRLPRFLKQISLWEFYFNNGELNFIPNWLEKMKVNNTIAITNSGVRKIESSIFRCKAQFVYLYEENAEFILYEKDISTMLEKDNFSIKCSNFESVSRQLEKHTRPNKTVFNDSLNVIQYPYNPYGGFN